MQLFSSSIWTTMNSTRRQPSLSFSLYLITSVAASSVAFLIWKRKRYPNRTNEDDKTSSPHRYSRRPSSGRGFASSAASDYREQHPLPSHLERELYKEERRKQMIPLLAMKKPMYDNILMKDPSGSILCTVGSKKANWYVRKNLACWEEDSAAIRLNFEPKKKKEKRNSLSKAGENSNSSVRVRIGLQNGDDALSREQVYNQTVKENKCVVCGVDKDYRRHYVVPYCYRSRFPQRFKTHMPHDVVILCPGCHVTAQQISHSCMEDLEDNLRRGENNVASAQPAWYDPVLAKVRSAACALLRRRDQLPDDKICEYTTLVHDYFVDTQQGRNNVKDDESLSLTEEQLQQASQLEPRQPNPQYISGPNLVMQDLERQIRRRLVTSRNAAGDDNVAVADDNDNDVELQVLGDFVREWRSLFYETMRPRCLPKGWHVDAPVICDDNAEEDNDDSS